MATEIAFFAENQELAHFVAFILAGLFYSCLGLIKEFRQSLSGEKVRLDPTKMGKAVTLGIVLGIGAFVAGYLLGDATPAEITTFQELAAAAGLATVGVMAIDKILLARPDQAKKTSTKK